MNPNLGILVLGYARPQLLEMVLKSLSQQGAIGLAHVWIDGTADLMEIKTRPQECADIARRYPVAAIRAHSGHLGNNKIILDSLQDMIDRYDRLIVLEDDCFPTRHAVRTFSERLETIALRDEIFSVYGHPFLTPTESHTITRFQGWGWATTRQKLAPILSQAREIFLLPEYRYLEFAHKMLTPEIVARLDVTPGRDVCKVLTKFFSWDACFSLLTALSGQMHSRTPERVVYNCGLGGDTGHFSGGDHLRRAPFNMIQPDEAWAHY